MGCVRQAARARNVEKESVCGCSEWFDFTLLPAHLPDLSPVLQMGRPDWRLSEIILAVDFHPLPFREEILTKCLCFPWCSTLAVCLFKCLLAAGVQRTSWWSYHFGDYYFSPQFLLLWPNDGLWCWTKCELCGTTNPQLFCSLFFMRLLVNFHTVALLPLWQESSFPFPPPPKQRLAIKDNVFLSNLYVWVGFVL